MKQGWEIKQLGQICSFVRGPFGGSLKKNCFKPDGYAVYEQQHAINNQFSDSRYYVDEDKFLEMKRFELFAGDLIMSCSGTMGRTAIVPQNVKKGIINQALLKLTPSKKLEVKYLQYWMESEIFQENISKQSKGTAIKNVASVKILKNIDIFCPPLDEQKRIVAKLDQCFEAIDQARANVERNLQNAKELFQSQLNQIFSQKGDGWVEKKLGEVCENLDSRRIPITKNKRVSGNIPYYGASGIVDYVADYIFDEELLLVSEDGANLLARTYPIAFSISGKNWVNNHAHVLKFEEMESQKFIEYYLNYIKLDDYVSGMAQPKLNQKMLNSIPVPYPSLETQSETVSQLDKIKKKTHSLESHYQQELDALNELKKSILQKAFNGELV